MLLGKIRLLLILDASNPPLQLHTVMVQGSAIKWAIASGIVKWHGSLSMTLFKLVGWRHI